MQYSLDLVDWKYLPMIESAAGGTTIGYGFFCGANKYFIRLKYTDVGTNDPEGDDFDFDGISNIDELTVHFTDPFNADTDGDFLFDAEELAYSTDPLSADTDQDGLIDGDEVFTYEYDPLNKDSDNNGVEDGDEDFDADGISNNTELEVYNTFPWDSDTDRDTLSDGDEIFVYLTSPIKEDTDADEMPDPYELLYGLNPLVDDSFEDPDGDTVSNVWEMRLNLHPSVADTDNNGVNDGLEDADLDTINNGDEITVQETDPSQPDSDGDGLPDGWEITHGFDPNVDNDTDSDPNNDSSANPDGDGMNNEEESTHNTDPNDADTDDDGVPDDVERDQGSNPNDPNDSEPPPEGTVPVNVNFGDHSDSHSEKYRVTLVPVSGDASSHASRFRTNRRYGVTQTDTFHLPRGSKYKVTLRHIATDPNYEGDPKPDFDYTLNFTAASGLIITKDENNLLGVHDENATFQGGSKEAFLYVPLFDWITPKGDPTTNEGTNNLEIEGKNEYVFNDAVPALMDIKLEMKILPEELANFVYDDGSKFSDKCVFALPEITDSTITWAPGNGMGMATVEGQKLVATAQYSGLPRKNQHFGLKEATFSFEQDSEVVAPGKFEVFYEKEARNNPLSEVDPTSPSVPPNWFFYWKDGEVCGIPANAEYSRGAPHDQSGSAANGRVRLADKAAQTGRVDYTLTNRFDPNDTITVGGIESNFSGIDWCAYVVAHELEHLVIEQANGNDPDIDNDLISDILENGRGGFTTLADAPQIRDTRDTYNLEDNKHPIYKNYGDNELRAIQGGLDNMVVFPERDWGRPGRNYGVQFEPSE